MTSVRNNVFETNSSSCHCLVISTETDFTKWQNGEKVIAIMNPPEDEYGFTYEEYRDYTFISADKFASDVKKKTKCSLIDTEGILEWAKEQDTLSPDLGYVHVVYDEKKHKHLIRKNNNGKCSIEIETFAY